MAYTKVVIRQLPPSLSEEQFNRAIEPIPPYNYFRFCHPDKSLEKYGKARAYINFCEPESVFDFKERFDQYVFVDCKGNESAAIVEYAPYQGKPLCKSTKSKVDPKQGTIQNDSEFKEFMKKIEESNEKVSNLKTCEALLEEIQAQEALNQNQTTPLLAYLNQMNEIWRQKEEAMKSTRSDKYKRTLHKGVDQVDEVPAYFNWTLSAKKDRTDGTGNSHKTKCQPCSVVSERQQETKSKPHKSSLQSNYSQHQKQRKRSAKEGHPEVSRSRPSFSSDRTFLINSAITKMVDQKPLKTELAYYKSVSGSSVDGEPETNLMSQNPIATHSASPTVHTVRNRRVLDPSSASSSASDAGYEANSYPHTHKPAYSSTLSGSSTSKRPLSGFHDSTSTDRTRLGPPKATGHLQRPVSVHHAALTDKPSGNGYRRPRHQISQEHRNDREPVGAQSCHNENDDSRIHPSQSHSSATAYRAEHKTGTGRLLAMWVARELAGTEDMVKARRHELGALRQEAREHGHNRPTASNYQPASSRSREDPPSNPSHSYDADEDRSRGYSSKGRFSRTKGLSIRAGAGTGTSSSHTGSPSTANSTSEEKVIWTPNRAHNHRPQGYSSMRKTQLHKNDP